MSDRQSKLRFFEREIVIGVQADSCLALRFWPDQNGEEEDERC